MSHSQSDRPTRILIVEDEGLIAEDISRRLKKLGFEVAGISASGEDAVQLACELRPELILMDVKLSGEMDGIAAAAEILKAFDVPIVFLTAHTDRATIDRAKRTCPFGYLTKPLQQHSLPTTIDIALYKHRVERELREQRAWLATILASIGDGVAVTDAAGAVQYLNPVAERMTGWSRVEAQSQPLASILAGSNSESKAQIEELLSNAIGQGHRTRLPRGLLVKARSGKSALMDGEISPSADGEGLVGAVLTFRDATVRELEEQHRRHEHKIRAVGTLAAGVAHDFNNLLMVILGYTEELERLPHEGQAQVAVLQIRKAAQNAASITKQLLQFSRKQQVRRRDLDINEVLRETEPLLQRLAGPGVKVEVPLGPEGLQLNADPDQLVQVMVNLTVNARDAMPDGGVLTIEAGSFSAGDAPFDAKRQGVILAVKDNGVGMSEEVVNRLFEPFFTTKDVGKGTGLGLSIVHSIVNDLGGVILVESKPNEGSTFLIYLPQTETAAQNVEEIRQPREMRKVAEKNATVLIVDDEDGVRELLSAFVSPAGYTVLTAADGPSALATAESHGRPIDVVVTDLMMPGMNGLQLANELKRRGLASRIIFSSGYEDQILRDLGNFPATSGFLPKPFSRNDLMRELHRILALDEVAGSAA